ncbi:uncharacterized protein LOC120352759 [Nilaparvata lugens]|uniref:uncharacterized protein LOC120352759 n=1 Tax=Nilaparvata lugens TaxID=108931 RepID=UPI00193CE121|nr:uncharacterized protein LOC120352759 [Nilaparvata lugens]
MTESLTRRLRWSHLLYLTTIDCFTRLASAWILKNKTAKCMEQNLLAFFGLFNTPNMLLMDKGKEFDNNRIKKLLEELDIDSHFTTVGHPQSHGMMERLHSTLTEHLHLLEVDRNICGEEAMARAILAYNSSIHSSTNFSPFELVEHPEEHREVERKIMNEKVRRTKKYNLEVAEDMNKIKVGDIIFKKNHHKRTKSDHRFVGPYEVIYLLLRNRVEVKKQHNNGRARHEIVHLSEIRRSKRNYNEDE